MENIEEERERDINLYPLLSLSFMYITQYY